GRRAFEGASTSEVIAAVLHGTPNWNALPASSPEPIVRVLRGCLSRDVHQRPQSMLHVRRELAGTQQNRTKPIAIALLALAVTFVVLLAGRALRNGTAAVQPAAESTISGTA